MPSHLTEVTRKATRERCNSGSTRGGNIREGHFGYSRASCFIQPELLCPSTQGLAKIQHLKLKRDVVHLVVVVFERHFSLVMKGRLVLRVQCSKNKLESFIAGVNATMNSLIFDRDPNVLYVVSKCIRDPLAWYLRFYLHVGKLGVHES
jgi:hypothetical protein